MPNLSLERVLQAFMNLGLSRRESEVYVHLATKGPQKATGIADALKLNKQKELYPALENLQNKGVVTTSLEFSTRFDALPFEKAIDLLMKASKEEVQDIEEKREEIISHWLAMISRNSAHFQEGF
jgi:sugar-specific transcriptional regulator TrmB